MAHTHSHRTAAKPTSLALNHNHQQPRQSYEMGNNRQQQQQQGFPTAATSSTANNDHSWQTERTLNLDKIDLDFAKDFDLVNFIAADSDTPLDDLGPTMPDEIELQKTGAIYDQWQYDEFMSDDHHDQQPHHALNNDFASVPNYVDVTSRPPVEAIDHMDIGAYQDVMQTSYPENYMPSAQHDNATLVPSTSRASLEQPQQIMRVQMIKPDPETIKEEPQDHVSGVRGGVEDGQIQPTAVVQEEFVGLSLTGSGSTRASSVVSSAGGMFATTSMTTTANGRPIKKPRKYRVKPEVEKQNPMYKVKRQKNNDAVRRSRDKAKQQQQMKDMRLQQLEEEYQTQAQLISEQAQVITELRKRMAELQKENSRMRQNCRCGGATGGGTAKLRR